MNTTENLFNEIKKVVQDKRENTTKLQEICNILKANFKQFNWVGFYLADPVKKELHLGPFVGEPTEYKIIKYGEGICGQAAQAEKTFLIPDVSKEFNYLPGSARVHSEIAVPLIRNNQLMGILDIDSHQLNAFSASEQRLLEQIASVIAEIFVSEKKDFQKQKINEKMLRKYKIMSEQAAQAPHSARLQERFGDLCLELGYWDEALLRYKKAAELGADTAIDKIKKHFKNIDLKEIVKAQKKPFNEIIEEALKYPFVRKGYLTIFVGALIFGFISMIPLIGFLLLYLAGYPYLLAYMFKILQYTEAGRETLPEWPEFTDWWESIYRPFFLYDTAILAAVLPLIIFLVIFFIFPGVLSVILLLIGILLAGGYFPIALIAVAVNENFFSPFNYPLLINSIKRIWRSYFITVIVLLFAVFIDWLLIVFLVPFTTPFIGPFVFWIISIYFLVVEMRILGYVYYQNKNLLNW